MMFSVIVLISLFVNIYSFKSSSTNLGLSNTRLFANTLTERIIPDPLPIVYVYDHCPFCVRVRMALGVKNIKHEIRFLANDDIPTPTALIGKKACPIWQEIPGGPAMPESLDIVAKIDSDPKFGPTNFIKPFSGRKDLEAWQKTVKKANSLFQRSRYMKVYLPEFATQDGRNAFVNNHPLGSYEKPEWKKELTMEQKWKMYNDAFEESLANIDSTNEALKKLDDLIHCHMCCTEGGISMDDIDLWSRLRSLTIVKGLVWPEKLRKYMEYFSDVADVPLYTSMAL